MPTLRIAAVLFSSLAVLSCADDATRFGDIEAGADLSVEEVIERFSVAVCDRIERCTDLTFESCMRDQTIALPPFIELGWPLDRTEEDIATCEAYLAGLECDPTDGFRRPVWHSSECDLGQQGL